MAYSQVREAQALEAAFEAAYRGLNDKQRQAVDAIEGPVMVIAGPGTGKTQILTLRIANILRQTDTAPESILALTFTKSGARAMRARLKTFIGDRAYQVTVCTFHALAEQLIRDYPTAYERIVGGQAATEIEKIQCIERILEDPALSLLRPVNAPDFYIYPILQAISAMKQENISPADLQVLITDTERALIDMPRFHEKGAHKGKERSEYKKLQATIAKQQVLHAVYLRYEADMRARRRYDFDDMIVDTVAVLTNEESVRLDLQERYQYILADEHQDVNGAQNAILTQLTAFHTAPNLFVVGDEKQAIYRFQGASLENFVHFESAFSNTTVIRLIDNYRSTQPILDAAHDLIQVDEGPLVDYRVPLTAAVAGGEPPQIYEYQHESLELEAIVKDIQRRIAAGQDPAEVAVIVRSNRDVAEFANRLRQAGIPADASADGDVLSHPIFQAVLDLLRAAAAPSDEVVLARVLQAPYWGIPLEDVAAILQARSYATSLSKLIFTESARSSLVLTEPEKIRQVEQTLKAATAASVVAAPQHIVAELCAASGLLDFVNGHSIDDASRIIRRLYDDIEAGVASGEIVTLADVVAQITLRQIHNIPLTAPFIGTGAGVQVLTAHKSKGLEFEQVYIPRVTEQSWGGSKRPDYFKLPLVKTAALELESNEDERRLLYVAITRAKRQVCISYAGTNVSGKVLSPSPFLSTLPPPHIVSEEISAPVLLTSLVSREAILPRLEALVLQAVQSRGISATSLNNIIKNPWHFVFRSVMRLPEPKSPALHYGTVMHKIMETVTRTHTRDGQWLSFSDARSLLERELRRLPLSAVEQSDLLEKGQASLAAYIPHLEATVSGHTKEEFSITVSISTPIPKIPELLLTGNLDRLDVDDSGTVTRVVDYKTGRPKSRREILGETASADGNYYRQLGFYALLLSLHEDTNIHCETGVLSFLEPDSKGQVKEELFVSDASRREAVQGELFAALETLLQGDFWFDEALVAASDYADVGRLWQMQFRM